MTTLAQRRAPFARHHLRPVSGVRPLGVARAAAARRILARAIATGAVAIGPGGAVTRRELLAQ